MCKVTMTSENISASLMELEASRAPTSERGGDAAQRQVGRLQWALLATIESAQRADNRDLEGEPHSQLCSVQLPEIRSLIETAVVVFDRVIAQYEREAEVEGAADSGVFHGVFEDIVETPRGPDRYQQIADVAFMARWELIRKLDTLADAERLDRWPLIAVCSSALRRVVKAVCGVERVLAEVEGHPSLLQDLYETQLQEALRVRTAYLRLIARLQRIEHKQLWLGTNRSLRLVGTALASLIGDETYQALRIEDRRTLRELQQRVLAGLTGTGTDLLADQQAQQRVLHDAFALGPLLTQINRRPELIAHDRMQLERLIAELERGFGRDLNIDASLTALRGRDIELDELADRGASIPRMRAAATRALAQLGPG